MTAAINAACPSSTGTSTTNTTTTSTSSVNTTRPNFTPNNKIYYVRHNSPPYSSSPLIKVKHSSSGSGSSKYEQRAHTEKAVPHHEFSSRGLKQVPEHNSVPEPKPGHQSIPVPDQSSIPVLGRSLGPSSVSNSSEHKNHPVPELYKKHKPNYSSMPESKRRPPRLELSKDSVSTAKSGGTSSSSGSPVNYQGLKTPQEIANDIAIQCVSPGIPNFMSDETRDAVVISRTIEAQQRKIIAQRLHQDEITPVSESSSAANSGKKPSAGDDDDNNNNNDEQRLSSSPSNNNGGSGLRGDESPSLRFPSTSLRSTTRRRSPPAKLQISQLAGTKRPLINSAPLARVTSPPRSIYSYNGSSGTGRAASNPVQPPQHLKTQVEHQPGKAPTTTTTIFVKHKPFEDRGAKTSIPKQSSHWLLSTNPHQRSRSIEELKYRTAEQPGSKQQPRSKDDCKNSSAQGNNDNDDEDDEEDDGRDPEDAALSDDEKEDDDAGDSGSSRVKRPKLNTANFSSQEKKERFLHLCSEMWDLFHES